MRSGDYWTTAVAMTMIDGFDVIAYRSCEMRSSFVVDLLLATCDVVLVMK